jgi:hypothetical protein
MKTYYGNYLGICISNNDPEKRGRVQVFIPHIMSALYENWNEKDINGNDVDRSFIGLGDNIQNGLPSAVIDKLKKILPWAESASPIIGASSPGTLTQTALAAIGSAIHSVASVFDQSPTANTPPSNGVNVVPNFYTSPSFNNGPVNVTYSSNPTTLDTTSNLYGIPTGSLSPNTTVNVSSLPENSTPSQISPGLTAAFAAIGTGETGFTVGQATTNFYNQLSGPGKNTNVVSSYNNEPGKIPTNGNLQQAQALYGDYGFYQNNDATEGAAVEKYLINQGYDANTAKYYRGATSNGQGTGNYSLADQTQAMSYLFAAQYPNTVTALNQLDPNQPNFQDQVSTVLNSNLDGEKPITSRWFATNKGLAQGGADPNGSSYATVQSGKVSASALVNKTDPHGPTASFPHNDTAKGMFSYPSPGAMLWVFFQEGNPLFPVYFAANYGAAEWKSAYKYGSPGPGYQPEGTAENPTTSTGGVMNVGPGVMRWEDTNDPKDNTKSQQSLYFGHSDGSNMLFNRGYHQIYSKFDRRDQVDGDRYHSTLGYKEEWVQGDSNSVTMGDVYIKIGNVSQPAVDACIRIQQLVKEIYQPLIDKNQGNV